jgi:uncharacterized protein
VQLYIAGMDPALAVSGLAVGLLVGLTGVGGGSLMTPLLILFFGIKPVFAVGTDLTYGAVTKTAGGIKHLREGTVDIGLSCWMALGSVPAAVGGVWVLDLIQPSLEDSFDDALLAMVSGAVLFAGLAVLARALLPPRVLGAERYSVPLQGRHRLAAVVVGVFVGLILGVTSVGSGALIGVALVLLFRLVPLRVVGTDVFHAAVLLWAAALAHIVSGNVDFGLAGNLIVGSVPGVWIGAHVAPRLPVGALRSILALVLVASGIALAGRAGWGPSVLSFAVCAVPSVVLVAWIVRRRPRLPLGVGDRLPNVHEASP